MKTGKNIKPTLEESLDNFDTTSNFSCIMDYDSELNKYLIVDEDAITKVGIHINDLFLPLFGKGEIK